MSVLRWAGRVGIGLGVVWGIFILFPFIVFTTPMMGALAGVLLLERFAGVEDGPEVVGAGVVGFLLGLPVAFALAHLTFPLLFEDW